MTARGRTDGPARGEPGKEASAADEPVLEGALGRLADLAIATATRLGDPAERYAEWAVETLRRDARLLFCGNGGSAATAQHVAAEYVVRFRRRRRPLAALALTTNSSVLTAAANDFDFDEIFARQIRALARTEDLLVVHSTSGNSPNLVRAAEEARALGLRSVGLLGAGGGDLETLVDLPLAVPAAETARAQELHLALEHAVVERVDDVFAAEPDAAGVRADG